MVLYNKQVEEQAEQQMEQQAQVEQQAQAEQVQQNARLNYENNLIDNFYFHVERREGGFVSYDYLAKCENIHEEDHIHPAVGYVECQECGHSSGCNGKVRYYEFDWHVRPRRGGDYWSKIVFPYCTKHINMVLQRHSYDPNEKIWTAGRDNWDALDGLYLSDHRN